MNEEYEYLNSIINDLPSNHEVSPGNLFGKPCFKINGKAFICFYQNSAVFKISPENVKQALSLPGVILFDPSGKGRPMKEWVVIPYSLKNYWPEYANFALEYLLN